LVSGFGLAETFFAGLSREGGAFFAGLSFGGSFFAEPLSGGLRLSAGDGRFFFAGWAGCVLPPRLNRRCKKCKKPPFLPPLMVSPG
jgi:hypothetical protein